MNAPLTYTNQSVQQIYDRVLNHTIQPNIRIFLKELIIQRQQDPTATFQKLCWITSKLLQESIPKKYLLLRELRRIAIPGTTATATTTTISNNTMIEIFPPTMSIHEQQEITTWLLNKLITRKSKSDSGVTTITVLTSPEPEIDETGKKQHFSCKYNCYYCPNEPGQPRSYLRDEPAVLRANQNDFDPILQFIDRAATLWENGHIIDKIEVLILGGTWSSYPQYYREKFCRDLFFAANIFLDTSTSSDRSPLSLAEEQAMNAEAKQTRIIGLTIETRPDDVFDVEFIKHLRAVGCTRVQLGLQTCDDEILKLVNRGCTTSDAIRGIRILKNACFKVDGHLMPNLPGSSPKRDTAMLERFLTDPDLQCDQLKCYPTEIVSFTMISEWFHSGKYVPYSKQDLMEVIIRFKSRCSPWIRLNRVVRDIPPVYQRNAGLSRKEDIIELDWRKTIQEEMQQRGLTCRCIRCREIGDDEFQPGNGEIIIRRYLASGGIEFFISVENKKDDKIYGFCRLRVLKVNGITTTTTSTSNNEDQDMKDIYEWCPPLQHAALLRELHVYGTLVSNYRVKGTETQHVGIGGMLIHEAERISMEEGKCDHIVVIAGVGVRKYYERKGFVLLEGSGYMMKKLNQGKGKGIMGEVMGGSNDSYYSLLFERLNQVKKLLYLYNNNTDNTWLIGYCSIIVCFVSVLLWLWALWL
jgi:ELP3 family radical SAM enzyme/protein acetyltransferase